MAKSTTRTRLTVLEGVTTVVSEHQREIALIAGLCGSTFAMVALVGYSPGDSTWIHPGPGATENPCGPLGALIADFLFQVLGVGAWATFLGMVACVLALAGRGFGDPLKVSTGIGLYLGALSMIDLAFGPGEVYPPGGWVGALTAQGLAGIAGTTGAWLVLLGCTAISVTVLFRIRWGSMASRAVGVGENGLKWSGERIGDVAGGAKGVSGAVFSEITGRIGAGVGAITGGIARTAQRMVRAIRRREDDGDDDWTATSVLDELDGRDHTPGSVVEATAASAAVALAEVHWVKTDDGDSSELLGMFPAMSPRPSTSASGHGHHGLRGGVEEPRDHRARGSRRPCAAHGRPLVVR
ncbi:MAG: DNA translocase FtsK 4TM domain-containing protein, partial [Myxococcota bacterium]